MRSGPTTIPDIAGPVTVDTNVWTGKQLVSVAGQPVPSTGRRLFAMPTLDGRTVEARISRSSLVNPFPTLEISGVRHPIGTPVPLALRIIAALPIVLVAGGLVGGLIGVCGVVVNLLVLRRQRPTGVQVALMLGVLVAAFLVWLVVGTLLVTATDT